MTAPISPAQPVVAQPVVAVRRARWCASPCATPGGPGSVVAVAVVAAGLFGVPNAVHAQRRLAPAAAPVADPELGPTAGPEIDPPPVGDPLPSRDAAPTTPPPEPSTAPVDPSTAPPPSAEQTSTNPEGEDEAQDDGDAATQPTAPVGSADPVPAPAEPAPSAGPTSDDGDDDTWGPDALDDDDDDLGDDYDPLRDSPEAIAARHWFRTGIGLVAAGGALGVGAIIIGSVDPCAPRAGNSCLGEARTRAALTMGVPALAFVAAGTAALIIATKRRKRLAATVAVANGVTLGVSGRF